MNLFLYVGLEDDNKNREVEDFKVWVAEDDGGVLAIETEFSTYRFTSVEL